MSCEKLLPLIEWIFSDPHTVSGGEIRRAVSKYALIRDCELKSLNVQTDRGSYELALFGDYIRVKLANESEMVDDFQLSRNCSAPDQIDILLQLMQAGSADEIRGLLTHLKAQGLVRQF